MTGRTAAERATALLDLHRPGDPVILPTVWDAWSAPAGHPERDEQDSPR